MSDEAIDVMVEVFARCPSPLTSVAIEHFHGAVTRVPIDATAVPHRAPGFNFMVTSIWEDPEATAENVAWAREIYGAMEPYASGLRYVNYFSADDAGDDPARAAYGPNYERLAQVKRQYDSGNLFRLNTNIRPAE
jgi:FAD/FMN-containing dehydrogenase